MGLADFGNRKIHVDADIKAGAKSGSFYEVIRSGKKRQNVENQGGAT
jgi:hypothetical protein